MAGHGGSLRDRTLGLRVLHASLRWLLLETRSRRGGAVEAGGLDSRQALPGRRSWRRRRARRAGREGDEPGESWSRRGTQAGGRK